MVQDEQSGSLSSRLKWCPIPDLLDPTVHYLIEGTMTIKFHYLVRRIIRIGEDFLLVRQIGADNTFLPGGHIGECERAEHALIR